MKKWGKRESQYFHESDEKRGMQSGASTVMYVNPASNGKASHPNSRCFQFFRLEKERWISLIDLKFAAFPKGPKVPKVPDL